MSVERSSPGWGSAPRPVRDSGTLSGTSLPHPAATGERGQREGHRAARRRVNLGDAADEFLSTHRVANDNTRRAYASAIDRTIAARRGRGGSWPTSPTPRSAMPSPSCGADARRPPGTATAPPSPPGSPGAPPRRDGRRRRSPPTPNVAASTSTTPRPSPRPSWSGCCPGATSRCETRRSTGCCTRPPPAPPRSSR